MRKLLNQRNFFTCLIVAIFIIAGCNAPSDAKVGDLRVEYLTNPVGVDLTNPLFSWKITSEYRGIKQQAYQIIVGKSPGDLKKKGRAVWDSGKITSGNSFNITYEGTPLQSNSKYYWQARIWTDSGKSILSEPAWFHTGIFDNRDWKASWITLPEEIVNKSPLIRKEFTIEKTISEAYLYVSAAGLYELYLNEKKVGDHVLDPAITDYRKTVLYSTFDVTRLLNKGVNVAGAYLGNGAWNLRKTEGRYSWGGDNRAFGNPSLFMQLMIKYSDGSSSVIVTDDSWKYTYGPITFNNYYGGEDYNSTMEKEGWLSGGYDDSSWKSTKINKGPGGRLKSQLMHPIRVTGTVKPVKSVNPSPGVYLYDLGRNIAGWWRVKVTGSKGQTIRIRGSETLNDSLFSEPLKEGDKLSTKHRYHSLVWTDYTLKGQGTEVYEPRFFYTGFRYIEVVATDGAEPEHLEVEGRVVHSDLEQTGRFESSDSLINRIYRAALWSQKGNLHGYPTDCPHREKGAYNGDGQVIAETSMHDFLMATFYKKWINDMRDGQEENGRIPNTTPTLVGGMGGGVAWGSAYILIPWWMHNYYGDTGGLKEHYPSMKRYLLYLRDLGRNDENPEEPYIINNFEGYWYSLGEWCSPGRHDCPNHPVVNTFYYYYNSLLMSQIAGLLGFDDDAVNFRALSDTVKKEFNKKFFNPETALYGTDEIFQTYQLLALKGGLVPDGYRDRVVATIIEDIEKRDYHLNTGIIGTKYLWPFLVNEGYGDIAFRIASQTTYPGYGYWIENGFTTLPEEWTGINSHNHQMFGSIVEYFYKYLAGIQSPEEGKTTTGYKNIYIEPELPAGLQWVNASIETLSGTVRSGWKKENGFLNHNVSVPANSTAVVVLPGNSRVKVWEGETLIWDNNTFLANSGSVSDLKMVSDKLEISIESGDYSFRIEGLNLN